MNFKLKEFVKNNYLFILIIFFFLLAVFIFCFDKYVVWWDSGVYVGMGKYIFSLGKIGLWEHIRPVAWPFILGGFWKLGLPVIFFGRLVQFGMFFSSIFLIYFIGKKLYSKSAGIIAAAFLASSAILFHLVFHLYTEIPAMFFTLLAYFLFFRKKYLLAGLFIGIAFLTKFPAAIFIAILFFFLLFRKQWKQALFFSIGVAITVLPFIIANFVVYGSIFGGLFAAQLTIKKVLGCNILRKQKWWYYFSQLFFYENKFLIAALVGIFHNVRKNILIILSAVLPLIYFMNLGCRDYRYVVVFLPFVILLASAGLVFLMDKFKKEKTRKLFLALLILAVLVVGFRGVFYFHQEKSVLIEPELEYFYYLHNKEIGGEIWTSNPVLAAYSDNLLHKIYYPVYDGNISTNFFNYLKNNSEKVEFVFLDNCGGGIICPPNDNICSQKNDELIDFLDNNFKSVFNKQQGRCWYKIYHRIIF